MCSWPARSARTWAGSARPRPWPGWLLAAVTGLGLMAAGRANRKTQLPSGPFLIAAAAGAAHAIGIHG